MMNIFLHQKPASCYLNVFFSEITEGNAVFVSSRYGFSDYILIEPGSLMPEEESLSQSDRIRFRLLYQDSDGLPESIESLIFLRAV